MRVEHARARVHETRLDVLPLKLHTSEREQIADEGRCVCVCPAYSRVEARERERMRQIERTTGRAITTKSGGEKMNRKLKLFL